MKRKTMILILISFIILIFVALYFAGNYFYNVSVARTDKSFLEDNEALPTGTSGKNTVDDWFKDTDKQSLTIDSDDGLQLHANYIPSEKESNITVILAHGYSSDSTKMANFAEFYNKELGYNVLLPDARGHGKSQGDYIGFGWPDRKDYLKWIDTILKKNGDDETIVLHGISMGGATVLMTSGEDLPKNVKAIIDDCGYTSVKEELTFQLKEMYNLPSFPLIPITSGITKLKAGYTFGEASAVEQVKKSKIPIFFIHGDSDEFVPTDMVYELYEAATCEKDIYIVKGAAHGNAFTVANTEYKNRVIDFLNKYI